jgi:hypothetical protein
MSAPTYEELMHMAERLAHDLQEYVSEGERGGSAMSDSNALLAEFEELRVRDGRTWQQVFTKKKNTESSLIDEL